MNLSAPSLKASSAALQWAQWCVKHQLSMCTAESCTAGLLAATLASVPGASFWFKGGVVAYSEELKNRWLGVPLDEIANKGVVSADVAQAMALGALKASGAHVALSSTGYAGPSGGSKQAPVGTVFAGAAIQLPEWSSPKLFTHSFFFSGTREEITTCAISNILFTTFAFVSKILTP